MTSNTKAEWEKLLVLIMTNFEEYYNEIKSTLINLKQQQIKGKLNPKDFQQLQKKTKNILRNLLESNDFECNVFSVLIKILEIFYENFYQTSEHLCYLLEWICVCTETVFYCIFKKKQNRKMYHQILMDFLLVLNSDRFLQSWARSIIFMLYMEGKHSSVSDKVCEYWWSQGTNNGLIENVLIPSIHWYITFKSTEIEDYAWEYMNILIRNKAALEHVIRAIIDDKNSISLSIKTKYFDLIKKNIDLYYSPLRTLCLSVINRQDNNNVLVKVAIDTLIKKIIFYPEEHDFDNFNCVSKTYSNIQKDSFRFLLDYNQRTFHKKNDIITSILKQCKYHLSKCPLHCQSTNRNHLRIQNEFQQIIQEEIQAYSIALEKTLEISKEEIKTKSSIDPYVQGVVSSDEELKLLLRGTTIRSADRILARASIKVIDWKAKIKIPTILLKQTKKLIKELYPLYKTTTKLIKG